MNKFTFGFFLTAIALLSLWPGEARAIITPDPEPELTTVFEEDFSLLPAIEPWGGVRYALFNSDGTAKDGFFHEPGWKGNMCSYGQDAGELYFETDDDTYLQTPAINLTADGGKVTIVFEVRMTTWDGQRITTDNFYTQLRERADGADLGITGIFSNPVEISTEWKEYRVTLQGGTADCSIRFWIGSFGAVMRRLRVMQELPEVIIPVADMFTDFTGDSLTANWRAVEGADHYLLNVYTRQGSERVYHMQDTEVEGTSFRVTGLDPEQVYNYTVKCVKGGNTSEESAEIHCFGIPKPELGEFSDIDENGFRISWEAPLNANIYQLETYVNHTAKADGKYYLLDEDFLNTPNQDASPDSPIRGGAGEWLDDFINRSNWVVKNPTYAGDCIGLDNMMASMGSYGELDGPTMNLSVDGGKVTVEMRVRALNAASVGIYMMNARHRENEFTSDVIADRIELWNPNSGYEPLNEDWTDRSFTLTGGNAESYIAIQAYGYGAIVQIDRLAISQNLKSGESIRVPFRSIITPDCFGVISTDGEIFDPTADEFLCEMKGAYLPFEGDTEDYTESLWSDMKGVRLPAPSNVREIHLQYGDSMLFNLQGLPVAPDSDLKGLYIERNADGSVRKILR